MANKNKYCAYLIRATLYGRFFQVCYNRDIKFKTLTFKSITFRSGKKWIIETIFFLFLTQSNLMVDLFRGSHQRCFTKKVFLEISQNLQENTEGLRPATSLKKRLWYRCFPVNFVKFLRTPFCIEQLRWLILKHVSREVLNFFYKKSFIKKRVKNEIKE